MVYCGKPSRGCQNCKTRRIKCDEVRPACTQCKKSNRSCPGYPDEFDLIFRNETLAVKRRAQRAVSGANSKHNSRLKASSPKQNPPTTTPIKEAATTEIKHQIAHQADTTESIPVLSSDASSSRNSSVSDGSYRSDIQDEESLEGTSFDALILKPTNSVGESPIFIDCSPTDQVHLVHVSTPSNVKKRSGDFADDFNKLSVPWAISNTPSEVNAIPYFFKNHVLWPRHADSQRGFLDFLTEMYEEARPNSLLHKATHAVSLGIMSNAYKSRPMRCGARKTYGKALQEMKAAIQSPSLATSDELLMTILLFSLYEQVTANTSHKTQWTGHIRGAVALVKLRARDQFQSARSSRLFRAVRNQMLIAAIQRGEPLEDYPDEKGWRCDEDLGLNAANRLSIVCLDIPYVKFYAKELLKRDMSAGTIVEMLKVIELAQDLDQNLEAWVHSLPEVWKPNISKIVTDEPVNVKTAFFWPGPVYTYQDLNVANVLNEYRICRIDCQVAIMKCIEAIPSTAQPEHLSRVYTQAIYIIRQMVDEFSATVPYMLGFDYYSRPEACPQDERSAKATGAFFALWPLYVTKRQSCLTPSHQQWLLYRLINIGLSHGLNETDAKPEEIKT